jgi:hypothetical protein
MITAPTQRGTTYTQHVLLLFPSYGSTALCWALAALSVSQSYAQSVPVTVARADAGIVCSNPTQGTDV